MRRLYTKPVHAQLIAVSAVGTVLVAGAALVVVLTAVSGLPNADVVRWRAVIGLSAAAVAGIAFAATAARQWRSAMRSVGLGLEQPSTPLPVTQSDLKDLAGTFGGVLRQLDEARQAHRAAQETLAARTRTMDRLLEFGQTIQGAGQAEQVFASLGFFLRTELGLAGLVMLAYDAEARPAVQLKASWPEGFLAPGGAPGQQVDLDAALCPCLRQHLPRQFRPDGSPVRCSMEAAMNPAILGDAGRRIEDYPAYCIPFSILRRVSVVVHMLLPVGATWTEEQKQLAQTYVNTAQSSLASLAMLAEAEKQSMTDALTGLYNRRSMDDLLQREVALAERHAHPLSVVMIDMDHFKQVNDAHGHAVGDHLLRAFADCVRMTLRKTDLAFRYGGDEFVIALPQTPLSQAHQVVQKLRQAFAAVDFTHAIANLEQQPTLSIGVAERSKAMNLLSMQQILSAADAALYDAKAGDRNCVKTYTPPAAA